MKKIAVIGDSILDKYTFHTSNRMSPEAPVPVAEKIDSSYSIGGAGLVAKKLTEGANVVDLYSQIGKNSYGEIFKKLSNKINIIDFAEINFELTMKDRFILNDEYFLRIDKDYIESPNINKVIKKFTENAETYNACMITDYNKGFVSERMYKEIINICKLNNIQTFFDPNINNKFNFTNVDFIKLNLSEAYDISSTDSIEESLKYFEREKITPIITQSSDGAVSSIDNRTIKVNAPDIKAIDVSGCGDIFFAVFVSNYISNYDVEISMNLAVTEATEYVKYFGNI
tara:strand:+ start:573 stop:1427 length:855 start_codon:yes stop_codon:yes gene_type:complete